MTHYLLDSNVWVALVVSGHLHHRASAGWLETIEEPASLWFCRSTQQSFLRLMTTPAVFSRYEDPPLTNDEAWAALAALRSDDRVAFQAGEPAGIEAAWYSLARRPTASPKLWMDAYLAAFARLTGCRLVTNDRGVPTVRRA